MKPLTALSRIGGPEPFWQCKLVGSGGTARGLLFVSAAAPFLHKFGHVGECMTICEVKFTSHTHLLGASPSDVSRQPWWPACSSNEFKVNQKQAQRPSLWSTQLSRAAPVNWHGCCGGEAATTTLNYIRAPAVLCGNQHHNSYILTK
jgi:hypothetical protein